MKIVRLTAENVKKLRAVEITPAGEVVQISGRNSQGKTSVLDSIYWALAGVKPIQGQPIRKGEHKARIKLDLGTLTVERRFADADGKLTTSVVVESADGARFPSPQRMLDELVSNLSFDPLAFARMEPKRQFDELRRVCKLEVDIEQLDALNAGDYAKRTDVNRDAKAKRAQADGISVPDDPGQPPADEDVLVAELREAGEVNARLKAELERRSGLRHRAADLAATADGTAKRAAQHVERAREAHKRALEEADRAFKSAMEQVESMQVEARSMLDEGEKIRHELELAEDQPAAIDTAALSHQITLARAVNSTLAKRADAQARKTSLAEEALALEASARSITERMEAREKAKRDAIEGTALPVAGLGFGAGHVTYNGLPFDQASSAEQLRVSMAVAMAANPKLRVIRITDGSLLDEDSMATIGAMAKEADFQVWLELVDSGGKVGVVIEDGAVVSTPESRGERQKQPGLLDGKITFHEGSPPDSTAEAAK